MGHRFWSRGFRFQLSPHKFGCDVVLVEFQACHQLSLIVFVSGLANSLLVPMSVQTINPRRAGGRLDVHLCFRNNGKRGAVQTSLSEIISGLFLKF